MEWNQQKIHVNYQNILRCRRKITKTFEKSSSSSVNFNWFFIDLINYNRLIYMITTFNKITQYFRITFYSVSWIVDFKTFNVFYEVNPYTNLQSIFISFFSLIWDSFGKHNFSNVLQYKYFITRNTNFSTEILHIPVKKFVGRKYSIVNFPQTSSFCEKN